MTPERSEDLGACSEAITWKRLEAIGACRDAITWVRESDLTLEDAWLACPRGDWLLWYAAKAGADRREIVRCACEIARIALPLVPAGEDRPRRAIEAAERWAEDPTEENRNAAAAYAAAANAAAAAAYSAYAAAAAAAAAAANAAAYAAAAYAAAYSAYAAAYAADAAANAAAANAAADAARARSLAHSAEIVRRYFPTLPAGPQETQ